MTIRQGSARKAVPIEGRLFTLDERGQPVLQGNYCPHCGCRFFPGRTLCAACTGGGLAPTALSTRGTLWTYTVVQQAPPGAIVQAPYVIGRVALPEGVSVTALIVDCPPESARVGLEVETVGVKLREDDEGRDVMAFAFRPAHVVEAER